MVADLREMQENQWVSEIRIDKLELNKIAARWLATQVASLHTVSL